MISQALTTNLYTNRTHSNQFLTYKDQYHRVTKNKCCTWIKNIAFVTLYVCLNKVSIWNIYGGICIMGDMKGGLIIEAVIRYLTALKRILQLPFSKKLYDVTPFFTQPQKQKCKTFKYQIFLNLTSILNGSLHQYNEEYDRMYPFKNFPSQPKP